MGKITFILGGARSGKSQYALKLAKARNAKKAAFIATCEPLDKEMRGRIALHRKARPKNWRTFEEPREVSAVLKSIGDGFDLILIDCLTLLVSNLLLDDRAQAAIESEVGKILSALKRKRASAVIVSNEVGLGIVPENKLARDFRDIAGRINQVVAERSDEVFFMVSGIPWRIK